MVGQKKHSMAKKMMEELVRIDQVKLGMDSTGPLKGPEWRARADIDKSDKPGPHLRERINLACIKLFAKVTSRHSALLF